MKTGGESNAGEKAAAAAAAMKPNGPTPGDRAEMMNRRKDQMRSAAAAEGVTITANDADQLGNTASATPARRKASARLLGG